MLAAVALLMEESDSDEEELNALFLKRRRMQIRTRNDAKGGSVPHPTESPWAYLFRTFNDVAYISRLGIPVHAFNMILRHFWRRVPHDHPGKRGRKPKILPSQALGLILEFYASKGEAKQLGASHGLTSRRTNDWLELAEDALYEALSYVPQANIVWPSLQRQREWGQHMQKSFPLVENRFGYVDGKNLNVQSPSDVDLQNAMYNGWLHCVFVTGVLAFGCDGCLIWAKHNVVGSWNDGEVAGKLVEKLCDESITLPGYGLVSDTAFPSTRRVFQRIVTPLKEGDLDNVAPALQHLALQISNSITSLRQTCEWGMGSIEKPYRRLLEPLPYNPHVRSKRLANIFRLWNLRVRTTGITQVANTYSVPIYSK
jgi:hypothetical protein